MRKCVYAYPGAAPALCGGMLAIVGACSMFSPSMLGVCQLVVGVLVLMIGLRRGRFAFLTDAGEKVIIVNNGEQHEIEKSTIRFFRMRHLLGRMEVHHVAGEVERFALPVLLSGSAVFNLFPEYNPKMTEQDAGGKGG
jgi:hypothetical protein